ncbi:hypothetical protein N0V83_006701 [Neocucurbitaria cava]|uniref:SnoaL-like domain-containing protein n=1 Tax=Neocucurbitaria cava TaxID=798079 RepID=A0A9W8Y6I5_9PLEO|nr:hypothetical protein N0V83_006701 [Neocucurbitaria cava]
MVKGLFFSPTCLQICRPTPPYAATTRNEIVQHLKDAQQGKIPEEKQSPSPTANPDVPAGNENGMKTGTKGKGRGLYTIRPLQPSEFEFSTNDVTAPVGLTAQELQHKSEQEGWFGMRVDLWDEGGNEEGLLVKVQYWWRLEDVPQNERMEGEAPGRVWRQCLHDIMYLGRKDGTEGAHGQEILE